MNVKIGQHLEEKIAEEVEERRLDSMEYVSEGDRRRCILDERYC